MIINTGSTYFYNVDDNDLRYEMLAYQIKVRAGELPTKSTLSIGPDMVCYYDNSFMYIDSSSSTRLHIRDTISLRKYHSCS